MKKKTSNRSVLPSKKRRLFSLIFSLIIMVPAIIMTGCSGKPAQKAEIDRVFTAINHLTEAKTLEAKGSFDITAFGKGDITVWIDNENQFQMAIQADDSNDLGFYLKDGKTYLNYFGTKSQSVAENIDIDPDVPMDFYNPLLDMSAEERDEIFNAVSVSGDTYTLDINKHAMATVLDNFGGVGVKQASLAVTLDGDQVKKMVFKADVRSPLLPGNNLKMFISLEVVSMNQPLDIPWPTDLDSYKTEEAE